MKNILFALLVCACSGNVSDPVPYTPPDPDPEPPPVVVDPTSPGLCEVRYTYSYGDCEAVEGSETCPDITQKAVAQVEHYSGSVTQSFQNTCPELNMGEFEAAQDVSVNDCDYTCDIIFDIEQTWVKL